MRQDDVPGLRTDADRDQTRDAEHREALGAALHRDEIRRIREQRRVPQCRRHAVEHPYQIHTRSQRVDREIQPDHDNEQRDTCENHDTSSARIHRAPCQRPGDDGAHGLRRHDAADLCLAGSKLLQEAWQVHEQESCEIEQRVGEPGEYERPGEERRRNVGVAREQWNHQSKCVL